MGEKSVLYRRHIFGGELSESMENVISIKSRLELIAVIRERLWHWFVEFTDDQIHVEHYGYDKRIDWDTYLVTLDGWGVLGYTNGELPA